MKGVSIVLLLTILCYSNGQKKDNKECTSNKADVCLQKLLLIGDPKFKFPENKDEMNSHCRTITSTEKCIKQYSQKCLDTFPRQATSVLAFGIAKTNKGYCANSRRKEAFISIGKCGNTIKSNADKCMHTFIDRVQGIESYNDNKMKIPLLCCNYFRLKSCIVELSEKSCQQENTAEIERIIDGYANEVLNLLCGEYTEESDKCSSIVNKTPKKQSTQKRPHSFLPPFVSILVSI